MISSFLKIVISFSWTWHHTYQTPLDILKEHIYLLFIFISQKYFIHYLNCWMSGSYPTNFFFKYKSPTNIWKLKLKLSFRYFFLIDQTSMFNWLLRAFSVLFYKDSHLGYFLKRLLKFNDKFLNFRTFITIG